MPGHKGLYGPQGTGLLLCGSDALPLIEGGTGSESLRQSMPDFLPDRLEAGTHNVPGIAGLEAGIAFVRAQRPERILHHSRALIRHMVTQKEMLGGILLSMHNIYYLLNLMQRARQAIIEGRYGAFVSDWMNSPAAVDY